MPKAKTINLKLNDQYLVPPGLTIKITELGTQTTFTVSGANVENPDRPRTMPTTAFANMLKLSKAKKLK